MNNRKAIILDTSDEAASIKAVIAMTNEQKLQIATQALQLIQEEASRPPHKVRQAMCEGLARKALEHIESDRNILSPTQG